jgi:hypothetical protein
MSARPRQAVKPWKQRDVQRRFALDRFVPQHACAHRLPSRRDLGRVLAAVPVEQHEVRAGRQPQHASQVLAGLRGQRDLAARLEFPGHVDTRQAQLLEAIEPLIARRREAHLREAN